MKTITHALALLAITAIITPVAAACLHMERPAPGTTAGVGPLPPHPAGNVSLRGFRWLPSGGTMAGFSTIVVSNYTAGSPVQEMNLNNISLAVAPTVGTMVASFAYADFGGNVNLWVNGVLSNTADLSGAPASMAGVNVNITRIAMFGYHFGTVTLDGTATNTVLSSFGVGGQEFFVDEVCW